MEVEEDQVTRAGREARVTAPPQAPYCQMLKEKIVAMDMF